MTERKMIMKNKVIDLSGYNPSNPNDHINYDKVKNDGINYVILKAINKNNARINVLRSI